MSARDVIASALCEYMFEDQCEHVTDRIVSALEAAGYLAGADTATPEQLARWLADQAREAGCQRFGEPGSEGWRSMLDNKHLVTFASVKARSIPRSEADAEAIREAERDLTEYLNRQPV